MLLVFIKFLWRFPTLRDTPLEFIKSCLPQFWQNGKICPARCNKCILFQKFSERTQWLLVEWRWGTEANSMRRIHLRRGVGRKSKIWEGLQLGEDGIFFWAFRMHLQLQMISKGLCEDWGWDGCQRRKIDENEEREDKKNYVDKQDIWWNERTDQSFNQMISRSGKLRYEVGKTQLSINLKLSLEMNQS